MATSDVPDGLTKYECILSSEGPPVWLNGPPPGWVEIPNAAHIRAQVLAEVDAALRDRGLYVTADIIRDTLGAGGEG